MRVDTTQPSTQPSVCKGKSQACAWTWPCSAIYAQPPGRDHHSARWLCISIAGGSPHQLHGRPHAGRAPPAPVACWPRPCLCAHELCRRRAVSRRSAPSGRVAPGARAPDWRLRRGGRVTAAARRPEYTRPVDQEMPVFGCSARDHLGSFREAPRPLRVGGLRPQTCLVTYTLASADDFVSTFDLKTFDQQIDVMISNSYSEVSYLSSGV